MSKRGESKSRRSKKESPALSPAPVGSDRRAAEHFGGKLDFGIPARKAEPGQQTELDGSLKDRPLGTALPPADSDGRRDVGVGAPDRGPGSYNGGDLDPDIIGAGTGEGLAVNPGERRTEGPDIIEDIHDPKLFGPPAKGENELPPGTHGTIGHLKGTVHDRMDREVRLGELIGDQDLGPRDDVDRSSGEDVDDREAATGSD